MEYFLYHMVFKLDNLRNLSMSKIIRVPLEDNRKKILIPYPNGYNWQNSRVIPVPLGNDLTSIPPIIKLTTDGVYFIAFNANQWFDLLFIFFKII